MADIDNDDRTSKCRNCGSCLKDNILVFLVLAGAISGFAIGFGVRPLDPSGDEVLWLGLPGDIFMRMLKMAIIPLIVASLISGTASLDPKANGKIGILAVVFVVSANIFGALMAVGLFFIFSPGGEGISSSTEGQSGDNKVLETQDLFADFIRNLMPDNVVTACFQKTQTKYMASTTYNSTAYIRSIGNTPGSNILGLIVVSSLIGMATARAGDTGVPFVTFFQSSADVLIILLKWLIWFTPIGVTSLIATSVSQIKELENTFKSLGLFVGTYTIGILFHHFVLIPILWLLVMRTNPLRLLLTSFRPILTVFAPPSSAIGIPEILNMCENKHGVDPRVSRFTVLFGATMSRMGSCYFICMSSLFIANLEGFELNAVRVMLIVIVSSLGALALPAVPSASIVTIIIVLSSLDITARKVGILIALEWYTDRMRATSNSMNNIIGTIFIHKICKPGLDLMDRRKSSSISKPDGNIEPVETPIIQLNSASNVNF